MALEPHRADPAYTEQMKERERHPEQWGAAKGQGMPLDSAAARVGRRLAAHYGFGDAKHGHLGTIAQRLLDEAKGVEAKVALESARAELEQRGFFN